MGKEIDIGDASGAAGIFIRKPGDKQAWLARSVFEPKSDAASWLNKNVISNSGNGIGNTIVARNGGGFGFGGYYPGGGVFPGGVNVNVITNSGNGVGNTIVSRNR